jgi:hypothetical protein
MSRTHAHVPRGWEATSSDVYNGGPLYLHDKRLAHCEAADNITWNRSHVINLPFYQQNPWALQRLSTEQEEGSNNKANKKPD